ncbi:MAG: HAD family hydrolase [Phycisphaerae bacterium]|nr:HAD family hydrolase [Phycisphaerae bacterium]
MTFTDIQAVLFDLGGTLADYDLPSWPRAVARCAEGVYGFLVRPAAELHPPAAAIPPPELAHAARGVASPEHPLPHRVALGLRRIVRAVSGRTLPAIAEACARPIMATGRLYDDALPTLNALQARGYRLGLVSNTPWGTPPYLWENQVERFGLASLLPVRVFSSAVGRRKPDPEVFRDVLARLDVPPHRAVFVGDTPDEDIAGARSAGMRTVLIVRGREPPAGTAPPPDAKIHSLADLLRLLP